MSSTALWYLSRSTGLVLLALLSATAILGIVIHGRGRVPGLPSFAVTGLHRNASLLAIVLLGVHIVTAVVDPFTYLELDGRRVIVASVLEADVIRRDSRANDVWTDDQFGGRELMAKGWSYHDAEMEVVRRVLERAGAQAVVVPPSFPVSLADYLR